MIVNKLHRCLQCFVCNKIGAGVLCYTQFESVCRVSNRAAEITTVTKKFLYTLCPFEMERH